MDIFNPFIFEIVMLVCFGLSWPFAIAKTIRTRSVEGLSIWFISLVFMGYLAGILFKLIARFDGVIWLYMINGSMIFTEMVLYLRYRKRRPAPEVSTAFCMGGYPHTTTINRKGGAYGS